VTADAEPVPAGGGQRLIGGRLRPYLQHHTMKLQLPRHAVVQRAQDEARRTRDPRRMRRHEVEAHWCLNEAGHATCRAWAEQGVHVSGDQSQTHDWVADETLPSGEVRRRRCQAPGCKALTWRKEAHARGDTGLGFVTRDHNVEV
jgi:hypothetical protein